jgi:hypothetical protein
MVWLALIGSVCCMIISLVGINMLSSSYRIHCRKLKKLEKWHDGYASKIAEINEFRKDINLILNYLKVKKDKKILFNSYYDGSPYYYYLLEESHDSLVYRLNKLYDYLDIEIKSIPAKPEECVIEKKVKNNGT